MLYKPYLADKLHAILNENIGKMDVLTTCCRHEPQVKSKIEVINICPGCDKRYRNNYPQTTTISLWEILAETDFFPFPDYKGKVMTIIDACPTRDQERVHTAIRTLLKKINITIIEPIHTRTKSTCCGDSFYGEISTEQVKTLMIKRSAEMPVDDVVVYCVSCSKSLFNGGKKPHYMVDLLFGETTIPGTVEPELWHKEIDEYIDKH